MTLSTPELRYLKMQLTSFEICQHHIKQKFGKVFHNLACTTTRCGSFDNLDIGTPLFKSHDELLGVAVSLDGYAAIFALVYNDVEFIEAFRDSLPGPRGGKGKGPGDIHPGLMMTGYSSDMGNMYQSQIGTPHPPNMTDMNLGHMGTPYQYDFGQINPGQMGTSHQYGMGYINPGQMGTSHLPDRGHMNQGDIDTHYQSNIGSHFPDLMGSQYTTDTDDLMSIVRSFKPINTRSQQSSHTHTHQDYNGPHSARVSSTIFENSNVQAGIHDPKSIALTGAELLQNPRARGKRPKERY